MRNHFVLLVLLALVGVSQVPTRAVGYQGTASGGVAAFVRVFPLDTPGLSAPVAVNRARMDVPNGISELGGNVEMDITVGVDGFVRDGMIRKVQGGARVEALALRAAANSRFQPGTMEGRPVPVRMPLSLAISNP